MVCREPAKFFAVAFVCSLKPRIVPCVVQLSVRARTAAGTNATSLDLVGILCRVRNAVRMDRMGSPGIGSTLGRYRDRFRAGVWPVIVDRPFLDRVGDVRIHAARCNDES